MSTLGKYALLQLPGIALALIGLLLIDHWWSLTPGLFWSLLGLWVLKDALLYPLLKPAYEGEPHQTGKGLVGALAITREPLDPEGYVELRGELWLACLEKKEGVLPAGQEVRIIKLSGLQLLVEEISEPPAGSQPP